MKNENLKNRLKGLIQTKDIADKLGADKELRSILDDSIEKVKKVNAENARRTDSGVKMAKK